MNRDPKIQHVKILKSWGSNFLILKFKENHTSSSLTESTTIFETHLLISKFIFDSRWYVMCLVDISWQEKLQKMCKHCYGHEENSHKVRNKAILGRAPYWQNKSNRLPDLSTSRKTCIKLFACCIVNRCIILCWVLWVYLK